MLSSIRRIAGASAVAAALLFALPTSANAVENSDIARPAAVAQSAEAAVAADATPAPASRPATPATCRTCRQ